MIVMVISRAILDWLPHWPVNDDDDDKFLLPSRIMYLLCFVNERWVRRVRACVRACVPPLFFLVMPFFIHSLRMQ